MTRTFPSGPATRGPTEATCPPEDPASRLTLADGASVEVADRGAGERLSLRSPEGELLMEYDPARGTLRLNRPRGDLELTTEAGDIVLNAEGAVRLNGSSVEARSGDARLRLDPSTAQIAAPRMAVSSRRARMAVGHTLYTGERVETRVESMKTVARRVERVAGKVRETAERVHQTVRDALSFRAGRVRGRVASSYRVQAKRVHMKGDDDVKVKGERIHLG